MPRQLRNTAVNVLLSLSALAFVLVLIELGMHAVYKIWYRPPPYLLENDKKWSMLIYTTSQVPGLAYELAPGRNQPSHGTTVTTNSLGMRDEEPLITSGPAPYRIIAIGDSYTFGFGVAGEHTYPNVLERMLNQKSGQSSFEVFNMGVGGYSSRDEALVLRHKALKLNPDLVILGYYLNDPEISPIQTLHAYFAETEWWQHFNLLRLVAKTNNIWDKKVLGGGDYFRYLHNQQQPKWQSVVTAFQDIARASRKAGVPVLVVILPHTTADTDWTDYAYKDLHQQVENTAKENGLHVLDLVDSYSRHAPEELMVRPLDSHPNILGHEITAKAIMLWLSENSAITGVGLPANKHVPNKTAIQ